MGYHIKVDGSLLYSSDMDEGHIVLNPSLTLDVNEAGSLSFTIPPGNAMHGKTKKLKSVVTVEQDGKPIFSGRIVEVETDMYNQQSVYCEGQKTYLFDSQIAPYTYDGTVQGLFQKLINNHNEKVEAAKRFTVGTINAVPASETVKVESKFYGDTNAEIEIRLLDAYGGYLRDRTVGNTNYLDWVKEYGGANSQPIEFAVNLLDIRDNVSAQDVFTVLIPLGAVQVDEKGNYTEPLTIASVNNGLDYIQDNQAVEMYGRIERTYTWDHVETASELLEKGREHLKTGIALQTLTLKAIDLHFVNQSASSIMVGDKVHIISNPHGIDLTMVCSRMVVDLSNPENTAYTFGEKPRVLAENIVGTDEDVKKMSGRGGGRKSIEEEAEAILRWASMSVSELDAKIELAAWDINELTGKQSSAEIRLDGMEAAIVLKAEQKYVDSLVNRVSAAEIAIDGAEAAIKLKANQSVVDDLTSRVSQAEIDIDGANAAIALKASQKTVDSLTERVSAAEVDIDGANAAIKLKASQSTVDGLTNRVSSAEIAIDGANAEIALKVNKNGVVSAINITEEEVLIKASKINLSGYVTASQLSAEIADINLNIANTVATDTLRASSAIISFLTFQDTYCTLKEGNFVTSVTFPVYQEANLYYLDWDGNKQSKLVLLPTKNTVGSYAKNKDYKYIGA